MLCLFFILYRCFNKNSLEASLILAEEIKEQMGATAPLKR